MKFHHLILLFIAALGLGSTMVSCTTTSTDSDNDQQDERARGISSGDRGFGRESIYKMQDRTFRQLAY